MASHTHIGPLTYPRPSVALSTKRFMGVTYRLAEYTLAFFSALLQH
jgi:hypothetical protein